MTAPELRSAAKAMLEALKTGDKKRLTEVVEQHGREIALAALGWTELQQREGSGQLSETETELLLRAYKNAVQSTPLLTEVLEEEYLMAAGTLSERSLIAFTSIPSFIFITRRGMQYVEENWLNA